MRQHVELVLAQQQRLAMTHTMQQAVAILQMGTIELWSFTETALLENPLLERAQDDLRAQFEQSLATTKREWRERQRLRGLGQREDAASLMKDERVTSLSGALREQVGFLAIHERTARILRGLIDCLDERGYLELTTAELASAFHVSELEIDSARSILQGFEPRGVGARDLNECLTLQLLDRAPSDVRSLAIEIVNEHLVSLAESGYARHLARQLRTTSERVEEAVALIRATDPRPGLRYTQNETEYIVPDVSVIQVGAHYVTVVNDWSVPSLRISQLYESCLKRGSREDQAYLQRQWVEAKTLIRSIDARQRTLQRVCDLMVEYQEDFFHQGPSGLRPLTMKAVADALHLHVSTVSRTVAGKYVQTPQGTVELRRFFVNGLPSAQGEDISSTQLQGMIRRMIEQERGAHPLSDREIAERLFAMGNRVSRRTVAKYREEMGFKASSRRKR